MSGVPLYQLRVIGNIDDAIRRSFVRQVIDEQALAQGALAAGLDRRVDVQSRLQAVMRSAMLGQLRAELGDGKDIPDSDVAAFYQEHKARYQAEKRLQLWQIVVPTRAAAEQILEVIKTDAAYRKDPVKGWATLVEKHSIDEATRQRHGSLDGVGPDGSTRRSGVTVSPALYQAADKVKDGEVVPEPVQDGDRFVVLQRRGTHESAERPLEAEAPVIRAQLVQRRYEERVHELLGDLRRKTSVEAYPERLDMLDVDADREGEVGPTRRPGGLPRERHPSESPPRPVGPPGLLR